MEVNALISELQKFSLGVTVLDRYLRVWAWPRAYAHGRDVCKNFTINGSASELLSFSPVLGTWLESVVQPTGHAARHVASALALCDVVDLLQHSGSGMVSNQDVETAIQRHLRLHLEAYGCTIWIPKHHYSAHLGDEEKKCNTFVLERKHQDAKRYANTRRQTQAYEKGILEDITVEQLFDMDKPFLKTPLRRAHPADENIKKIIHSCFPWSRHEDIITGVWHTLLVAVVSHGTIVCFGRRGTTCVQDECISMLLSLARHGPACRHGIICLYHRTCLCAE